MKKLTKLTLKKESICSLSHNEQMNVKGGWTTSFGECSKPTVCCDDNYSLPKSCVPTNCPTDLTCADKSCTCV